MTREIARRVLEIEADSIKKLIDRLDESFERAVDLVSSCRGRVVVTGMGKSGIIGRKIAATLNSTGTPSLYLNPAEALHGDLGMVVSGDVVVLLSNSGRTRELVALVEPIKRLSVPLIALLGNRDSTLGEAADVVLDVSVEEEACPMGLPPPGKAADGVLDLSVEEEACPMGLAPTASTTASLALGDALAMSVLEKKGFGADDFRTLHPNGQLGFKLMRVEDAMHRGDDIPKVRTDALMRDAIYEMSRKGLGVTSVVDGGGG